MQNPGIMRPMNPAGVRPTGPNGAVFPNQPIGNLEPVTSVAGSGAAGTSSSGNNPMLRNQLESNNLQQQQRQHGGPSKLVEHLTSPGPMQQQQPQQQQQQQQQQQHQMGGPGGGGNNILRSQLAKTPVSDPNPATINKVAGSLASKLPNETLPGLMPSHMSGPGGVQQQQQQQQQSQQPQQQQQQQQQGHLGQGSDGGSGGIKFEIKQEADIKKEVSDGGTPAMDTSGPGGGGGGIKPEIKKEIKTEPGKEDTKTAVVPKKLEPKGANKVSFTAEELKKALEPPLTKMWKQDPESVPFRTPVDPNELGIPDYFEIIKKPMDMSSIRRNLENGVYKDPWEFVDDIWLMFENAWVYNRKTSRVYKYCTKVR